MQGSVRINSQSDPVPECHSIQKCHIVNIDNIAPQHILQISNVSNSNICLVSNFTLSNDKHHYVSAPPTPPTGCSVLSGIISSSNFARKNKFPIFEKPLGQISYNVRVADISVMSIAGYVHSLYLKLDGKDFLFLEVPVSDTLSFEAILGFSACTKYALDFDNTRWYISFVCQ